MANYLHVLTWDKVHADVFELSQQVLQSSFRPELLIGIAYGGIIPATLMYFCLPETGYRVLYPRKSQGFELETSEFAKEVKGKRVLLIDDLAISGDSLLEVKNDVKDMGASEVAAAALYHSSDYTSLEYSVRPIPEGELIVFPWYALQEQDGARVFKFRGRFGKHEPKEEFFDRNSK